MIRTTSFLSRTVSIVCCATLINIAMPQTLGALLGESVRNATKSKPAPKRFATRPLSAKEMKAAQGRQSKNPYAAGSSKWAPQYKGVDLFTGNFTTSATDMTFEGGYGIPINVTRSYSANLSDEGPLGVGWTLSVDVRSTAGGLLKSSGAPIRSVPVSFKERNSAQLNDPNAVVVNGDVTQPVSAVLATDASGQEETEQRDVDGVITTPPWDKNTNDAVYETVTFGGNEYRVVVSNTVKTPDGTTYVYQARGSYQHLDENGNVVGGASSSDGSGTAEPSNVLKITSATDRQGNVTTYTYDTSKTVSFAKPNGTTYENPLTSILMPNGHQINFTWGNGTDAPTNRIRTIDDEVSGGRTVTYGYTGSKLTSVTTPAGLTTTYGYGSATQDEGEGPHYIASDLLTSITDPRGLSTTIGYVVSDADMAPYMVQMVTAKVYKIQAPNGVTTHFVYSAGEIPSDSYFSPKPTWAFGLCMFAEVAAGHSEPFYVSNVAATMVDDAFVVAIGSPSVGYAVGPDFTRATSPVMKVYDARTQDLLFDSASVQPIAGAALATDRGLNPSGEITTTTSTETAYNFMGNPLVKTMTEHTGSTLTRQQTVEYSYWGADKYFQQKATRVQTGASTYRYSYTDYFDSSAAAGAKGQTKAVYSPAFTTFTEDSSPVPSNCPSNQYWKYRLIPYSTATPAAKFYDGSGNPAYDSKGRVTDVWKLQKIVSGTPSYVQTHTTYGGDGAPHWGQAYEVVEDYGSGKINRTTTTNAYTSWGTANDVTDAAGHRFYTDYDGDGRIHSVTRTDVTPNEPVVTYTYNDGTGTNLAQKYQVSQIEDNLSGIVQTFSYCDSGGGRGQVASVSDDNSAVGASDFAASYTYSDEGDRAIATYSKDGVETARWGYRDYVGLGNPLGPSRVFQTLVKLDGSNNPTSEEFQYVYDSVGRLRQAAFAQTPASGFTPDTGNSYYDEDHLASSRARAYYLYDAGGRLTQLNTWWDTWNSGTSSYNTPEAVISNTCAYEVSTGTSNANRGLKTTSNFYVQDSGTPTTFALDHQEVYGYDANLDYLTSASYDGGSTSTTWSYDAAGNRNDATVVDNLNRATTIGGVSRTYDVLGNTLTIGSSKTMTWDILNRMLSLDNGTTTTDYAYRADGMRVVKETGTKRTSYGYDGQMPIEESLVDSANSNNDSVIRYALGARGMDRISRTTSSGTTTGYPLYDAHGNNVATLSKSGSSYSLGDQRSYDAWGGIRAGNTSGEPNARYCANLGHLSDDESGFAYLRARYYEPYSGRFVNQDPVREGWNWFVYALNSPPNYVDLSGKSPALLGITMAFGIIGTALMVPALILIGFGVDEVEISAGYAMSTAADISFTIALLTNEETTLPGAIKSGLYLAVAETISFIMSKCQMAAMVNSSAVGMKTYASIAVAANFVYTNLVLCYIAFAMMSADANNGC